MKISQENFKFFENKEKNHKSILICRCINFKLYSILLNFTQSIIFEYKSILILSKHVH